jgi:hypothetical protein
VPAEADYQQARVALVQQDYQSGRDAWAVSPAWSLRAWQRLGDLHSIIHWVYDAWRMYERDQLLRQDIGYSKSVQGSAVVSVQPQGKFQSELKEQWMEVMNVWNTQQPAIVVHVEGVPLLTVTFAKEETGM